MNNSRCKGICKNWRGMINFIPGVPNYALADQCVYCYSIWFPKHLVNKCPCCDGKLRHHRKRYRKGMIRNHEIPAEEIRQKILKKVNEGWTLLNIKIWKTVMDYRITNKMDL